jgi:aconitate hydratase
LKIEVGLIGSCTNSSYEDIARAASIAKQVTDKKLKLKSVYDHSGSEVVRYTIERDGFIDTFEKIGATVFANACGPSECGIEKAEKKNETQSFTLSTVTSQTLMETNTMAFVGSPELVTAMAIAGDLGFNPLTDTLINEDGEVMLDGQQVMNCQKWI